MRFLLLAGAFLFGIGAAQDAPPPPQQQQGPYRIGDKGSPPRLIFKVEPKYSEEARLTRLDGTVRLHVLITTEGRPTEIRVIRSNGMGPGLGLGLDENAIECVSQWKFQPGLKAGNPVAVEATVEVNFRLLADPNQWRLTRVFFDPSLGASRPEIAEVKYPGSVDTAEKNSVSLSFDVNKKGLASKIHVEKSSDPKWGPEAVKFISEWQFRPSIKDGKPVVVHATMDFVRGN
jgi:TonB family protein